MGTPDPPGGVGRRDETVSRLHRAACVPGSAGRPAYPAPPGGRSPGRERGPPLGVGEPADGSEHRVGPGTAEVVVVMEDSARHRYVATDRVERRPDGRLLPVFAYQGREHPLRSPGG